MKVFYLILFCFILLSECKESNNSANCGNLKFIPHYYQKTGNGYFHHIILKNYSEECFNNILWIDEIHNYLDTIKKNTPICGISFYSSDADFPKDPDHQNWEIIKKDIIIYFYFAEKFYSNSKYPRISALSIYVNGKEFEVNLDPFKRNHH
jgi:hypothetical protein